MMKVEIWSDIMCPFCYIGKRRFEKALTEFAHKDEVEISWKSYLLNPELVTQPGRTINEYLSETKGISPEQARELNAYVTNMASGEGLNYDFDKVIVANTFDAHRLLQFASAHGKGDEMGEILFRSYFIEGKNIADHDKLVQLAVDAGLEKDAVKKALDNGEYTDKVEQDIYEAQQIGVRGVPFFLLNDRYAVSGAQAMETFKGALEKAWGDMKLTS